MPVLEILILLIPMGFIGYAFYCSAIYLVALFSTLRFVKPGKGFSYLMSVGFINFSAAEQYVLPAGKAGHELVMKRLRRGVRVTLIAVGVTFAVILVAIALEAAGVIGGATQIGDKAQ